MESLKIINMNKLTKELIADIQHVCCWYQGRDVDACERVEAFIDSLKE